MSIYKFSRVRLFLSEESPAQVGLGAQDHLQAKASWLSPSTAQTTDDVLPPGFEGGHTASELQIKVSDIPVIKWRCPSRFVVNLTWQVVSGEESKEVEAQNQREMRVLEAVYPRPSAIPPNPTISADIEGFPHNDHQTPLIPITGIEDEDSADIPTDLMGPSTVPLSSEAQLLPPGFPPSQRSISSIPNTAVYERSTSGMPHGVEQDALTAASAAFAALNKSNEQGSLIDHDLLVKILSNPNLLEKLVTDYGTSSNAQNMPKATASFSPLSEPPPPVTSLDPSHLQMTRMDSSTATSIGVTSTGPFYGQPNGVGLGVPTNLRVPSPSVPATSMSVGPVAKDVNYYKNLIQQHGGERQETQQFGSRYNPQLGSNQELGNHRAREFKPKIMKPCLYYNTARGCRNGANCAYQHDASSQQRGSSISDAPNAKRMKMDREISS
ncbi:hypothetical protein Tsubulata_041016 [Turnera subulata]|uniref:C3H1-type domain-containing protein n=1 Tax=Turnera subulata TaxID=218843 RepID=A0A9Q0G044_9ROSI|nr:hypothetical protein Tsubulata_041016 [Turnera subulata]